MDGYGSKPGYLGCCPLDWSGSRWVTVGPSSIVPHRHRLLTACRPASALVQTSAEAPPMRERLSGDSAESKGTQNHPCERRITGVSKCLPPIVKLLTCG